MPLPFERNAAPLRYLFPIGTASPRNLLPAIRTSISESPLAVPGARRPEGMAPIQQIAEADR